MAAKGFLFGDTFDYYSDAQLLQKWTNTTIATNTAINISTSAARNGIQGIRITFPFGGWPTGSVTLVRKTLFPGDPTTFVSGMGFRYTGGTNSNQPSFFSFVDNATPQVLLKMRTDGTIGVYNGSNTFFGSTTAALLSGTYYHLKMVSAIHSSAGSVQLWLNGVSIFNASSINTNPSGGTQWTAVALGNTGVGGSVGSDRDMVFDYDDLYVRDNNISRFDLTGIALMAQAGNGTHTDFTPLTGTDHGNMVKEVPNDGDTTYNYADTVGLIDTYNMADLPANVGVAFLQSVDVARKIDPGDRLTANVFRIGGVDYVGTDSAPSEVYTDLLQPYDISPATGVSWTKAEVDAMEAGIKITL